MPELYDRIYELCQKHGMSIGRMCDELGISRGNLTELKMGRIKSLKVDNLNKISTLFGVSIDQLLGGSTEKAITQITDDELKFALWGNVDVMDDDDLEDVRRYAAFIAERKRKK